MAMNGRKCLSFPKDNPTSVSSWYRLGFMPPIPQEVIQRPRTKISALPSLVEGCPCRPGAALPQASGLQDLGAGPVQQRGVWKRRTTPADPVCFWERAQCNLPLTLAPREAEEQAWASLGWLPTGPLTLLSCLDYISHFRTAWAAVPFSSPV